MSSLGCIREMFEAFFLISFGLFFRVGVCSSNTAAGVRFQKLKAALNWTGFRVCYFSFMRCLDFT